MTEGVPVGKMLRVLLIIYITTPQLHTTRSTNYWLTKAVENNALEHNQQTNDQPVIFQPLL